jgi:hypothetical protein
VRSRALRQPQTSGSVTGILQTKGGQAIGERALIERGRGAVLLNAIRGGRRRTIWRGGRVVGTLRLRRHTIVRHDHRTW